MATQPEFTSLHRERRLSAQAADQIAQMIIDHQLEEGDRLPSERRLAESLGVSRTVVREAIRLLEARRLVEVRTGSGAVVRGPGPAPVTESITMLLESADAEASFEDVQAVRGVLEVATATLAAKKATEEDLDQIEEALARMIHAGTVKEQITADYDFHLNIARATHNKVFVLLLQALNDILVTTWRKYWESGVGLGPDDYLAADTEQSESNTYHAQIYQAIRSRDKTAVQAAMAKMLEHWSQMYAGRAAGASRR